MAECDTGVGSIPPPRCPGKTLSTKASSGAAGCEGRKPVPSEVVAAARRLARKPRKGKRPSLRAIAAGLAAMGHLGPSGQTYGPESVKRML